MKICSVDECERSVFGHGLCQMHYARVRKHGSTELPVRIRPTCRMDGCDRVSRIISRELCSLHYQRWKDYGDPAIEPPTAPRGVTIREKLDWHGWDVDGVTGCWEWRGPRDHQGYGKFKFHQRQMTAHREMLILHKGEPPSTGGRMVARHDCDNRCCVNPGHLRWGTQADNVADTNRRGRHRCGRSLSWSTVCEIRGRHEAGETQAALAREYGVDSGSMSRIVRGELYKRPYPEEA